MLIKGCFYEGASLCRPCVSSVFGMRADFGMDASHVFPQGVLAVITLIGDVVGVVVSRACTGYFVGPPLCSIADATLSGWGVLPSCWIRNPEGQV